MENEERLLALIKDVTIGIKDEGLYMTILLHNENCTYVKHTCYGTNAIYTMKRLLEETRSQDIARLKGKVVYALYSDKTVIAIKTIPFYKD